MARPKSNRTKDSSANIGIEAKLWLAADKLRDNIDAAEYKHVVLGLVFLKYVSDTFSPCAASRPTSAQSTPIPSAAIFTPIVAELHAQFAESGKLEKQIKERLATCATRFCRSC
jgi:hypothetical protein